MKVQIKILNQEGAGTQHSKAPLESIYMKDGFTKQSEFYEWFKIYPDGKMAILHFTDFKY